MPLVALLDGERLESFRLAVDEWTALRETYRGRELRMTCGSLAIPKTSPRGLRFFAHKPGGADCALHAGAPEGQEHLQAKALLAQAARDTGWQATIEYVGPERAWVADVLVERGDTRVALEVQWSPQTLEEFAARTARYEAAGIRARWFLGRSNHTREVPHSYKLGGALDALTCGVPGPLFEPDEYLPLAEAARLLLGGAVRPFAELRVESVLIEFYKLRCWAESCGRWYSRWWVAEADVISRCGAEGCVDGLLGFYAWHPWATSRIEQSLGAHVDRLTSRGDWPDPCGYESRYTKQSGKTYAAAICPHCGLLQGDAHLLSSKRPRVHELRVVLDVDARRDFPLAHGAMELPHRCDDTSQGRCEAPRGREGPLTFPMPLVNEDE